MRRFVDADEDIEQYLQQSTTIDPDDLNAEFIRLPGAVAFWNARLAEATLAAQQAKLDYDREWARLFCLLRDGRGGGKAPAVDAIKAQCDQDEDLYALQADVIRRDAERLRIRGIVEAVLAKRDMLQSLGAKLREEMRGDPMLRQSRAAG
jgi:hypothetical protein